jgi:hypothetical protein
MDVDYYNDLILHNFFPVDQIYAIQLEKMQGMLNTFNLG